MADMSETGGKYACVESLTNMGVIEFSTLYYLFAKVFGKLLTFCFHMWFLHAVRKLNLQNSSTLKSIFISFVVWIRQLGLGAIAQVLIGKPQSHYTK